MTKREAINIRTARRKYLNKPIEAKLLNIIQTKVDNYNNKGDIRMEIALGDMEHKKDFYKANETIYESSNFICLISNISQEQNLERLGYWARKSIFRF